MAIYTATLSAQNTSVLVANITRRSDANSWEANACATGTFGGGTVSFQISFDSGTTKYTLNQDGTNSAASLTAAGCINLRVGNSERNSSIQLYATIGAATTPTITITVADNK